MPVTRMGRPQVPDGYGVEFDGDFLDWTTVEARLVEAVHYWMAMVRPDGRPHLVPRWGVWLDERFWYDGSPDTRHAINLRSNPNCVLHLESGSEVTIVEGAVHVSEPLVGEMGERLSAQFVGKYADLGYAPGPDSWSNDQAGGLLVLKPEISLAWSSFPTDVTKFSFTSVS